MFALFWLIYITDLRHGQQIQTKRPALWIPKPSHYNRVWWKCTNFPCESEIKDILNQQLSSVLLLKQEEFTEQSVFSWKGPSSYTKLWFWGLTKRGIMGYDGKSKITQINSRFYTFKIKPIKNFNSNRRVNAQICLFLWYTSERPEIDKAPQRSNSCS